MKTADLIAALAADAGPVKPAPVMGRLVGASLAGALAAGFVLVTWLGLRPLGEAVQTSAFWMKAGYTLALALAGFLLAGRLARPAGRTGAIPTIAILAVATMIGLAAMELMRAAPGGMRPLWMGHSASVCSLRILALSVPIYGGAILVMRRLAPTRPAIAGAATGLLAGGVGASLYGLYCQETAATFVACWYTLGIGASAAIGAAIGARVLRW
jgi:hypothetical protein